MEKVEGSVGTWYLVLGHECAHVVTVTVTVPVRCTWCAHTHTHTHSAANKITFFMFDIA